MYPIFDWLLVIAMVAMTSFVDLELILVFLHEVLDDLDDDLDRMTLSIVTKSMVFGVGFEETLNERVK